MIFTFGTTPYSSTSTKGKSVEGKPSSVEARFPPASTLQTQPASNPIPPFGQRISFGYTPPPPPPPLKSVYTRGGTPATYLAEEGPHAYVYLLDPSLPIIYLHRCSVNASVHPNGSTYHSLGGAFTSEDLSQPGSIERFSKAMDDIYDILRQPKYFSVFPSLGLNRVVIRGLDTKTPEWHYVALDMGLYIRPNPPEFPNKGQLALCGTFNLYRLVTSCCPDLLVEKLTRSFWEHLEAFPFPFDLLPEDIEVDFLSALVYGANGECPASSVIL